MLKNMTDYQSYLHQQALKIAAQFRKTESELLDILQKIENKKVYRQLGYSSLFVYATQELKLSEAIAYSFIQVARKAKEVPELKTAVAAGELTISKAHRIAPIITSENKDEILNMAKNLPKRELEKEVAKLNPQAAIAERIRYVSEQRLECKLGISEELMQNLKRIQDLLSSQKRRTVSIEETLASMAGEYLERHDPVQKAQRILSKKVGPGPMIDKTEESYAQPADKELVVHNSPPGEQQHASPALDGLVMHAAPDKTLIPAQVKHQVILKAQGQCSYVDKQGNRCQQQRWLHLHHKTPRAYGGGNNPENLTLLCAGHHRVMHR